MNLIPDPNLNPQGRTQMIRNSLYVLAACLMSLGTLASTAAMVTSAGSVPAQIA